ncbi:MAG TPA: RNA 2',3'-cyclic phosphodiesterase [Gemmatimonadaceae bacterium]|jgi:RNA 2',3'-cyclic 3'-phosphodiesterase|nr:RNA 2',3'-cyclic phosphodiesterase [Gemmatimonadaceae bacterium]
MRLFLAIELGDRVLDLLDQETAPLRTEAPDLSWTIREKRHLTLKFLGEVSAEAEARLIEAADRVAVRHRPLSMSIGGIGAFPNFRRARVVWIGVEQEPRLELLHHDLEIACEEAGFELDGRPFRPHITLARVRTPLPVERARALARVARSVRVQTMEQVERITLFESTLAPSGAPYRRIHAATLGGR